eukprot:1227060-Prymnesium_polylepis.2
MQVTRSSMLAARKATRPSLYESSSSPPLSSAPSRIGSRNMAPKKHQPVRSDCRNTGRWMLYITTAKSRQWRQPPPRCWRRDQRAANRSYSAPGTSSRGSRGRSCRSSLPWSKQRRNVGITHQNVQREMRPALSSGAASAAASLPVAARRRHVSTTSRSARPPN